MLVRTTFPFRASYTLRPSGRAVHSADFVAEETVEIAEISEDEAEPAWRIVPSAGFRLPDGRRPPIRRLVRHDGHCWWPVHDGPSFRALDTGRFLREMKGAPSGKAGRRIPDLLGRAAALDGRAWPAGRLEAVPVRTLIESRRDEAYARLHRAAADLLLVGRRLHRRGSDPAWLVRADINRFGGGAQHLFVDVLDVRHDPIPYDGHETPVPFLHYELFRADREDDARALIAARLEDPAGDYVAGVDRWRIEGVSRHGCDPLTPMLRTLHDRVHDTVRWGLDTVVPNDSRNGMPDWLNRLAGLDRLAEDASARRLAGWISETLSRLDGTDAAADVFGWIETLLRGLRRAAARTDRDIAAGLVPLATEDERDDGALAWLAGA